MVPKRADSLLTQPIQNHDDVGKRLALRWTIPVLVSVVQTPGLATFPTTEFPMNSRAGAFGQAPPPRIGVRMLRQRRCLR